MDADMKNELQQVANRVAQKLMNCCSSWGGNNLNAEVDFANVNVSKLLGEITMPVTVSWRGSLSGSNYWIRGTLIINAKSGGMEWQKQNDSGGFSPGCSKGCIR
jgi:hypothetical protein